MLKTDAKKLETRDFISVGGIIGCWAEEIPVFSLLTEYFR